MHKEHTSTQDTYNQDSGTLSGAESGHNTKDRKNKHSITSKLIIIIIMTTTYFKNAIDKVRCELDSLKVCYLKMALCDRSL
jgi:hypothetical protein